MAKHADTESPRVEVVIVRDFWDENGERQPAGKIIEVTVEAALDGIETGALARPKKEEGE